MQETEGSKAEEGETNEEDEDDDEGDGDGRGDEGGWHFYQLDNAIKRGREIAQKLTEKMILCKNFRFSSKQCEQTA